jgi:hypothetical protein
MKRLLIPGLVLVHLLLYPLILWSVTETSDWDPLGWTATWPEFFRRVLFALAVSQAAVVALWIALGRRGTPWRVALAAVATALYLWCLIGTVIWVILTIQEMGLIVALLLCARLTGLELTRLGQQSAPSPRFQFSVRDVLAWTTALAVVLIAGKCRLTQHSYLIDYYGMRHYLVTLGALALIAVAFIWVALGELPMVARSLFGLTAIFGGAALLRATFNYQVISVFHCDEPSWFFPMLLGFIALWLLASLLVVRWAGYRLNWQWRFSRRGVE